MLELGFKSVYSTQKLNLSACSHRNQVTMKPESKKPCNIVSDLRGPGEVRRGQWLVMLRSQTGLRRGDANWTKWATSSHITKQHHQALCILYSELLGSLLPILTTPSVPFPQRHWSSSSCPAQASPLAFPEYSFSLYCETALGEGCV